ncbi:unnamed protein product [Linum tenue]|uniref:Hydroxyproline O-arabinosyltransferase-like domain-containing protein n=1 Tax=Linum tenue TaxID=586396 RepID=A0AAV0NT75_9ROSI|nr:unnamed protein product [Linum tenue]
MILRERKTVTVAAGRSSSSLVMLIIVFLGFFFATYNIVSTVMRHRTHDQSLIDHDPVVKMPQDMWKPKHPKAPFHVAMTATDSIYNQWQCRIMYYWYKRIKDHPISEMGGFTRILHSGKPDSLMDEIPTIVVDPLPPGMDQWLEKEVIEEDYILMAEPDHIFVSPLPNLSNEGVLAAFPFFYIKPLENADIVRKYFREEMGPISNVDPIGNSPVIISKDLLQKIAPTWMNVSIRMKSDPDTDRAFGWVLEMYAYAIASALHGVQHILRKDFMLQGELTYGKIGEWRFDKRSYVREAPPRNLPLPPKGVPESVVTLVKMVNEATENIPNWGA